MVQVVFALGLASALLAMLFGIFGMLNNPKEFREGILFGATACYRVAVILLLIAILFGWVPKQ